MNNNYEVLEKFLKEWKILPEFLGVLVSGSYATNTTSSKSDMDVVILMNDDYWHIEMGEIMVDQVMISYSVQTKTFLREGAEKILETRDSFFVKFFEISEIIYDTNDELSNIKKLVATVSKKDLFKYSKNEIEFSKYDIYENYKKWQEIKPRTLKEGYKKIAYYKMLHSIFRSYSLFLAYSDFKVRLLFKLSKIFNDAPWRDKNKYPQFPDKEFINLFEKCLDFRNTINIENLVQYTLAQMGEFNEDEWEIDSAISE